MKTNFRLFVSFVSGVVALMVTSFAIPVLSETAGTLEEEAFSVSPMEMNFTLVAGAKLTSKFRVKNKSDSSMRIRVDAFERTNELDGAERRQPTKKLKLSDREFEVPGGGEKEIEISYTGPKKLKTESAYRVVIKQVDADVAVETGKSLDLRFVYVASVYVSPDKAKSNLLVERVLRINGTSVEVDFSNSGSAHQKLSGVEIKIRQGVAEAERQFEISEKTRRQLSRLNVLARGRLRTVLEVSPGKDLIDGLPINVSVK